MPRAKKETSSSAPSKSQASSHAEPAVASPQDGITDESSESAEKTPRLVRLKIWGYRAIGTYGVDIPLDDIVVLVGQNNTGKSTILDAYKLAMEAEEKTTQLTSDDFFERRVPAGGSTPENPGDGVHPRIEIHTKYFRQHDGRHFLPFGAGCSVLRERFTWSAVASPPLRETWVPNGDATAQNPDEKDGTWQSAINPWGAANKRKGRRAQFHRISGFASPEDQNKVLSQLLKSLLVDRVKQHLSLSDTQDGALRALSETIATAQRTIAASAISQMDEISQALSSEISQVFPDHILKLEADTAADPKPDEGLFLPQPAVRFGVKGAFTGALDKLGTGARRTLLWAVLRSLEGFKTQAPGASRKGNSNKQPDPATPKPSGSTQGQVLLLDEPEVSLHPAAIRMARDTLYTLAEERVGWQVLVTTHSPQFIDLSRDHTTIVRVDRDAGRANATTLFRSVRAEFDEEDKQRLKLLNAFDAHVAEMFFGGQTVVVEGDTEHTAFRFVMDRFPKEFGHAHIVRARGKATIGLIARILNQFEKPYAILHDADSDSNEGGVWTINETLKHITSASKNPVRHLASIRNFDQAMFGSSRAKDKPFRALQSLQGDDRAVDRAADLLRALLDPSKVPPARFVEFADCEDLLAKCNAAEATANAP